MEVGLAASQAFWTHPPLGPGFFGMLGWVWTSSCPQGASPTQRGTGAPELWGRLVSGLRKQLSKEARTGGESCGGTPPWWPGLPAPMGPSVHRAFPPGAAQRNPRPCRSWRTVVTVRFLPVLLGKDPPHHHKRGPSGSRRAWPGAQPAGHSQLATRTLKWSPEPNSGEATSLSSRSRVRLPNAFNGGTASPGACQPVHPGSL